MGSVYNLTLRQLSGRWRLVIMTVLAVLPVVVAVLMVLDDDASSVRQFEETVLSAILAGSVIPLVVLAIAAPAFGNEVEDRTLANLTLTPVPRWRIAVPKVLASISLAGPFVVASALATSYVAFLGDVRAVLAVTVSALVGLSLYAAAFTWLGLVSTQAIGVGLFYIVVWEGLFSGFVTGVRAVSIRWHAIALMHGLDPRRFAGGNHADLWFLVAASVLVFAGFLWLATRRLRTMDVP